LTRNGGAISDISLKLS